MGSAHFLSLQLIGSEISRRLLVPGSSRNQAATRPRSVASGRRDIHQKVDYGPIFAREVEGQPMLHLREPWMPTTPADSAGALAEMDRAGLIVIELSGRGAWISGD
jgi:hypothetical protein